jgi:HAD superfamily hydrolase (TIGR01484 family)
MRPLSEMPETVAASVAVVLADIDDTLTHHGRLPAEAYRALEDLHNAGLAVAPITGRPAGWCDMIARFWPVAGVVGENGAFYFAYDAAAKRMRRVFAASDAERAENRRRLADVQARILAEVPGAAVAADQAYREADLAIDFSEDVPPLDRAAIARIKAIFEDAGATAKISSIHVNGWFGQYDKLAMSRRFAADVLGLDLDRARERIVFVGDSPNDAPMFGFFPHACGVANVRAFTDELDAAPAYVTENPGGHGFVEVAARILAARRAAGP